jgi:hypothetical protein
LIRQELSYRRTFIPQNFHAAELCAESIYGAKKPAISPAFPFACLEKSYLRLRAALRAAFFRARVRAPLRADALRAALLPLRGAFFFAAAMLSLHDEVELSPTPWWNRRVLHRVLTGTRAPTEPTATTSSKSA